MIDTFYIDDLLLGPTENSMLLDIKGLGMPSPRSEVFERANTHGAFDHTRFHNGRLITLTGVTLGTPSESVWEAFDDLKRRLALGHSASGLSVLKFRLRERSADEFILAKVSTPLDEEIGINSIKWAVTLFAQDPRIYTNVARGYTYFPLESIAPGGVAMPLVFPLVFSGPASVGTLDVVNGGTFPTPPFMSLVGPIVNPIIQNLSLPSPSGEYLSFVVNLGASDWLYIDSAQKTVLLNGVPRPDLLDASTSTWWELRPGTNAIRVSGDGITAATIYALLFFDARI